MMLAIACGVLIGHGLADMAGGIVGGVVPFVTGLTLSAVRISQFFGEPE